MATVDDARHLLCIRTGRHWVILDDNGDGRHILRVAPDGRGPDAVEGFAAVLDRSDRRALAAALSTSSEEGPVPIALQRAAAREVTDEMVERVAVGMVGNGDPDYWCCLSEPQKEWHRGRARRALDAAFRICAMRGDEPPRTEATDRQAPGE